MTRVPFTIDCAVTGVPRLIDLVRHVQQNGHVLLRGLLFSSSADFYSRYGYLIGDYIGHRDYSTSGRPSWLGEKQHHIDCNLDQWPQLGLLFCVENTFPKDQGLIQICNNKMVTENLPSDLYIKFIDLGINYIHNEIDKNDQNLNEEQRNVMQKWQNTFRTESKDEIERICKEKSWQIQWSTDGHLKYQYHRPAFVQHPVHGDLCLFNDMVSGIDWFSKWKPFDEWEGTDRPYWCQWGDGQEFSEYEVETMNILHAEYMMTDSWQKGDALLFDNMYTTYGQAAYIGGRSQRDIDLMTGNRCIRNSAVSNGIGKCRMEYDGNGTTIVI